MTIKGIQPYRKFAALLEGIVLLGLPFLKIKGESALRFDVPSLRLHFFGATVWMDEFFLVLMAVIFLAFLGVFLTLLFGRIWCGWVCPQTVLADFTGFVDRARKQGLYRTAAAYGAVAVASVFVSANLIWYFVSPYTFWERLVAGNLGGLLWGSWLVLAGVMFLNLAFLRQKWCATVCPYAILQSVIADRKTLVIAFDGQQQPACLDCLACVRTCPVGIDIRKGAQRACLYCARCIDKCAAVLGARGGKGLISYCWGFPGEGAKASLRTGAVLVGSLTLAAFFFLVYLSLVRTPLDLVVLPHDAFPPRAVPGKGVINAYLLALKNRSPEDEDLSISIRGPGNFTVTPGRISLQAGEERKIALYVTAAGTALGEETWSIELSVASGRSGVKLAKKVNFIKPGEK